MKPLSPWNGMSCGLLRARGRWARRAGMTWAEVLIAAACVFFLLVVLVAWALLPVRTGTSCGGSLTQTLSNMKQLHLATQHMTLDNDTAGGSVAWTCSNNVPLSYDQWRSALVTGGYLTVGDFQKLTKVREGNSIWNTKVTTNAITVFAVTSNDAGDTLVFATKNWSGPGATNLSGRPHGTNGFAVFHKAGDGVLLIERELGQTNSIGGGGKFHYLPLR